MCGSGSTLESSIRPFLRSCCGESSRNEEMRIMTTRSQIAQMRTLALTGTTSPISVPAMTRIAYSSRFRNLQTCGPATTTARRVSLPVSWAAFFDLPLTCAATVDPRLLLAVVRTAHEFNLGATAREGGVHSPNLRRMTPLRRISDTWMSNSAMDGVAVTKRRTEVCGEMQIPHRTVSPLG